MARVKKAMVVLLMAAAIGACTTETPEPRTGEPTAAPEPTRTAVAPDCPNQDSATSSLGSVRPGSLSADVDGDGSDDTMFLAVDEDAPAGCRAFLVADTSSGTLAEEISEPDITFDLGLPTLEGTVQVDGRPGDEIIVRVMAGASTLFVGLFTLYEDELERIEISGAAEYGNLFPSGGSVGHLEGSDCTEDGIVVSLATPRGKGYEVTRTFYSISATHAAPAGSQRDVVRPRNLDRFPEFAGPPFVNCGQQR
jgi:hypothetical protein